MTFRGRAELWLASETCPSVFLSGNLLRLTTQIYHHFYRCKHFFAIFLLVSARHCS
jgi:hypothetical protein